MPRSTDWHRATAVLAVVAATTNQGGTLTVHPDNSTALVPYFHPRPIDGMHTNDPNAPFRYNGVVHLFSDTSPRGCTLPSTAAEQKQSGCCSGWSHYATRDLVRWRRVGASSVLTVWFLSLYRVFCTASSVLRLLYRVFCTASSVSECTRPDCASSMLMSIR